MCQWADDVNVVWETGKLNQVEATAAGAGCGFIAAVVKGVDAGHDQGAGAHGARFMGDIKVTIL